MNIVLKKFFVILGLTLILFIYFTPQIEATINPDDFKPGLRSDEDELLNKGKNIVGSIQVVGTIVSVVALAGIGIKYLAGSAEAKAEYKETMMPYIIGAVLVFAASNLTQVFYEFGTKINN